MTSGSLLTLLLAIGIPLAALTLVVVLIALVMRPSRRTVEEWREAARQLGMSDVLVIPDVESVLEGTVAGFRVRASETPTQATASGKPVTELVIEGGLPRDVSIGPENFLLGLIRGTDDVQVGDPELDDRAVIQGDLAVIRALLDHETRAEFRRWIADGVRLIEGRLLRVVPGRLHSARLLTGELRPLIALAERLVVPADLVPRLVAVALHDPIASIRKGALSVLAERFSQREETHEALRQAMHDESEAVRLEAAVALGEEGEPVLLDLASRSDVEEQSVVGAVVALGESLPLKVALNLLERAVNASQIGLAATVIDVLWRIGGPQAIARLAALIEHGGTTLADLATRALSATGDPSVEGVLVAALDHQAAAVRSAAAEGLGAIAGVSSVAALHATVEQHPRDRSLRRAAMTAIAEIQSRATGAAPGQLTMAEGGAGDLSLADGDPGQLSLADDEDPVLEQE